MLHDFIARRDERWLLRRCAAIGHVVARIDDADIADVTTAMGSDGTELRRCLRCATFVELIQPNTFIVGDGHPVPLSDVPLVVRGTHGRKVALLRVLAAERFGRGVILAVAALGAFTINSHADQILAGLHALSDKINRVSADLGIDFGTKTSLHSIEKLVTLSHGTYVLVGFGLLLYGTVQILEGIGLWRAQRWGEYLAASATTLFIPLEVYEIHAHPTTLKWLALAVNITVVAYLIHRGRLFGFRGGHDGYLREVRDATLLADLLRAHNRDVALLSSHSLL